MFTDIKDKVQNLCRKLEIFLNEISGIEKLYNEFNNWKEN